MNMEDAQSMFDMLAAPFPLEYLEWRVGSTNSDKSKGMALCYVDARAVMDRLDSTCGPDGWQNTYSAGVGGSIICNIGVLTEGTWVWKADGAGATDVEGEKGALSDAFKRAAVRWGVGRYLYDLKSPWVDLEPAGRSQRIKDSERSKLDAIHEDFAKKMGWGIRGGIQAYRLLARIVQDTVTQPSDVEAFKANNAGMIAQLPVAMRKHLDDVLDRVGG